MTIGPRNYEPKLIVISKAETDRIQANVTEVGLVSFLITSINTPTTSILGFFSKIYRRKRQRALQGLTKYVIDTGFNLRPLRLVRISLKMSVKAPAATPSV